MNGLNWLVVALIIGLLLFLLVLFTKITIIVKYYHFQDNDDLKIELRAWFGLIKYKINIPLIKVDDDSPSLILKGNSKIGSQESGSQQKVSKITPNKLITSIKNFQEILKHIIQFNVILRKLLQKVSVKEFKWSSAIGVGDAALTGMLTGALWTVKGSILGLISHYFRMMTQPEIMVVPYFQQMVAQTELRCMFQFRIGHAIVAGLKLVKFWKGGRPHLDNPNTMSDEKTKSV